MTFSLARTNAVVVPGTLLLQLHQGYTRKSYVELFPNNLNAPSLPYLRISAKLLLIPRTKLFQLHPPVTWVLQVDRDNPKSSTACSKLHLCWMIYGLSFSPTKTPKIHASAHQATCTITSTCRDRHESLPLKKAVRWSTKGNLPPGN